jgi:hypothetical protein
MPRRRVLALGVAVAGGVMALVAIGLPFYVAHEIRRVMGWFAMRWVRHSIPGVRGPLADYWTRGNEEIVPLCTATSPETTVEFGALRNGRAVGLEPTIAKAMARLSL